MPRFFICLVVLLMTIQPNQIVLSDPADGSEITGYITVIDDTGKTILQTGLAINAGDEYIDEDNRTYQITDIKSNIARARYIRNDTSMPTDEPKSLPAQAPVGGSLSNPSVQPAPNLPVGLPPQTIAIYHTHTDESYTPSDGEPSQPGNGSIMLVGDVFANRLQELGYNPLHDKTLHEPHDANAYQRSRRTFTKLLGHQPAALFDIHRDSAPLPIYKATINGQDTAKILLVVGRQNQNHNTTLNYARQIKTEADKKYRGLVRGIFIAHGNYNQDLSPRAMLIEVGTQYNTREAAERSVSLFADIIPSIIAPKSNGTDQSEAFVGSVTDTDGPPLSSARNYTYDIILILSTVILGTIAYLYLSTGSWREVKNKLYRFRNYEFTNFLGMRKKRNRK